MSDQNAAPTTGPEAGATPGGAPAPAAGIPQPQDSALVLGKAGADAPAEPENDGGNPPAPGADPENAPPADGEENDGTDAPPAEAEGDQGADEGEGEPVSTLEELIQAQEFDPEWFDSLQVTVKVDGKEAAATVKDLVASYQTQAAAENRLEEAKAKAKDQTRVMAERTQATEEQYAIAASLIEQAEAALDVETNGIDWNALREDDEGAYAAKKADVAERKSAIDRIKRDAAEKYQAAIQEHQNRLAQDLQTRKSEEREKLFSAFPEWRDEKVMKAEDEKLSKYLLEQGFTEQDLMGASDHRLIVLAHKAMRLDQGQNKADAAKKKLRKVQKVLKPGTPAQSETPKPASGDRASILYG